MNKYSSTSTIRKSNRRKPPSESSGNGRVRLSVTRWQEATFAPMIVRQTSGSRLNFFNS